MEAGAGRIFGKMIKFNNKLQKLELSGNFIPENAIKRIQVDIERNKGTISKNYVPSLKAITGMLKFSWQKTLVKN